MTDKFLKYVAQLDAREYWAESAVFEKGGTISIMSITAVSIGSIVIKIDSRNIEPAITGFPSIECGRNAFEEAIKLSVNNGWQVIKRKKLIDSEDFGQKL